MSILSDVVKAGEAVAQAAQGAGGAVGHGIQALVAPPAATAIVVPHGAPGPVAPGQVGPPNLQGAAAGGGIGAALAGAGVGQGIPLQARPNIDLTDPQQVMAHNQLIMQYNKGAIANQRPAMALMPPPNAANFGPQLNTALQQ